LLVKHRDSRRPSSWKEPTITRTKEEAVQIVEEFRSQIAAGGISFEELASTESDCSSYKRGGDLGPFGRGKMQKEFENAAYVDINLVVCLV
jgi:NIMA-interacting peptidyl-prolyl cis-trans isomerase 1